MDMPEANGEPAEPRETEHSLVRPYEYAPLKPDEIRILVLLPGRDNDPLHGTLEIVPVADRPKYKAISYAWGSHETPERITISREVLKITTSLASALRRFRSHTEAVRLWADAVCISQDVGVEKTHQIARMGEIYKRAEKVLVWLGDAESSDCIAYWMINFLVNYVKTDSARQGYKISILDLPEFSLENQSPQCGSCPSRLEDTPEWDVRSAWQALESFWRRSWFGRLWVVQEYQFAGPTVFYWGNHESSGRTIERAAVRHAFSGKHDGWSIVKQSATYATAVRNLLTGSWICGNLLHLLISSRTLACSKPRDRLFAIRSLVKADTARKMPRYNAELVNIWIWAARQIVANYAEAFVLLAWSGTQTRSTEVLLPSWAPDLSQITDESERKYRFNSYYSGNCSAGGRLRCATSCTRGRPDVLRVRGLCILTIHDLLQGSRYERDLSDMPWNTSVAKHVLWYLKCERFVSRVSANQKAPRSALRSLLGQNLIRTSLHYSVEDAGFKLGSLHPDLSKTLLPNGVSVEEAYSYQRSMYENLIQFYSIYQSEEYLDTTRVLASTKDGPFGWVPELSRPGDLVCLLKGAPFPFIVRPANDGCYTFVGDAYIQGIMKGEAWPENEEGVEWLNFV